MDRPIFAKGNEEERTRTNSRLFPKFRVQSLSPPPNTPPTQISSPNLVMGNSCRKKNLEACSCYEFRVRAASSWGWSSYCDPVMVVTLPPSSSPGDAGSVGTSGDACATSPQQKV